MDEAFSPSLGLCVSALGFDDPPASFNIRLSQLGDHDHWETIWNSQLHFRNHRVHVRDRKCHHCHLCLLFRIKKAYPCLDWHWWASFSSFDKRTKVIFSSFCQAFWWWALAPLHFLCHIFSLAITWCMGPMVTHLQTTFVELLDSWTKQIEMPSCKTCLACRK